MEKLGNPTNACKELDKVRSSKSYAWSLDIREQEWYIIASGAIKYAVVKGRIELVP